MLPACADLHRRERRDVISCWSIHTPDLRTGNVKVIIASCATNETTLHGTCHSLRLGAAADVLGVDLGRRIMRNRKPVNVKNFAQLHNLIMFFLSLYMVIETVVQVRSLPLRRSTPRVSMLCWRMAPSSPTYHLRFWRASADWAF